MNLYDFDGTIYDGESNKDLIMYAMKKYPFKVLKCLIRAKKMEKAFYRGYVSFEKVKEEMLGFIFTIENYPKFINDFVDSHMNKIKAFYNTRRTENDVIVSASYDLWINLFAKKLGIKYVIATRVNNAGKIQGINCKGDEKLRRVRTELQNAVIENAYGDSQSDEILLLNAKNGFVVEGNKLIPYVRGYKFKKK